MKSGLMKGELSVIDGWHCCAASNWSVTGALWAGPPKVAAGRSLPPSLTGSQSVSPGNRGRLAINHTAGGYMSIHSILAPDQSTPPGYTTDAVRHHCRVAVATFA